MFVVTPVIIYNHNIYSNTYYMGLSPLNKVCIYCISNLVFNPGEYVNILYIAKKRA